MVPIISNLLLFENIPLKTFDNSILIFSRLSNPLTFEIFFFQKAQPLPKLFQTDRGGHEAILNPQDVLEQIILCTVERVRVYYLLTSQLYMPENIIGFEL